MNHEDHRARPGRFVRKNLFAHEDLYLRILVGGNRGKVRHPMIDSSQGIDCSIHCATTR